VLCHPAITQDELIEALRSEGRHQAQYRNMQRARRDGSHSGPASDDDMGGYGGGYDRPMPKRRRSSNSQRGAAGLGGAAGGAGVGGLMGMEALYGAAMTGVEHGAMLSELMGIPGYGGMGLAQLQMLSQAHAAAAAGMDGGMGLAGLLPAMDMSGLAAMADGVAAAAAGDGSAQQQQQQQAAMDGQMAGYGYTAQQLQSMGQEAYQQLAAAGGMGDMQAALASAAAAAAAAASANAAGSVGMEALAATSAPQLMMGLGQQMAADGSLPAAVLPPVADLDISGAGAAQGDGAAGAAADGGNGADANGS
jgi:hypothetical protein